MSEEPLNESHRVQSSIICTCTCICLREETESKETAAVNGQGRMWFKGHQSERRKWPMA